MSSGQNRPFSFTMPKIQKPEDLLDNSEIEDFVPSDEDVGDSEFQFPTASSTECDNNVTESSSSEAESNISSEERLVRGRGHATRRVRGRRIGVGRGLRTGVGRGRGTGIGRGRGIGRGTRNRENRRSHRLGTRRGQENEDEESSVNNEDCPNSGTWSVKKFDPRFPQMIQPAYLVKDTEGFTKTDYLKQYIDDELIDLIQRKSNQTAIEKSGPLVPLKKIQQLRAFKMELGEYFIEAYCDTNTEATDSEEDNRPLVRRTGNKSVPVPNDKFRTTGDKHLPYMAEKVGPKLNITQNTVIFLRCLCEKVPDVYGT
ncbi:unnamed protein product [Parnassius apollo]|uniref:(apollo) hypothetical protein n=1 Tax=Parnassius apollo TaxID=110799 RepID=A0A8S3WE81_PARAO|nr:unnamed protein product [Parnassius apollo]